ncbi:type II toxin-antitoxin system VapC family toxin [Candidatus Bathyarchaeota archaeon]|nr:type II toxin-antitoxin system VapC family toxin [Candidatus Bathyarchaeota archaeon]MBS7614039.1 type II toxin-antitoxin system VapC family toxin [Candidatus Bathyarchaeota archaeon]MBS7617386.1 type II toxin-antitoxin system VapC family toxin [Candidatus Bathyarchaeota archaeon]
MILLDSTLIVAYSNEADENHAKALQVVKDLDRGRYGTPVITDYIFDEVVTVMLIRTKSVEKVFELGETLLNSTLLLRIDEHMFSLAWSIFKEQKKPTFSFTDCTNIAVCRVNGISNIATFDEDFQKLEGYTIVGLSPTTSKDAARHGSSAYEI